jgi:hypothetical protein
VAVIAPAADGATKALYLVEGHTATQLATLDGTTVNSNRAEAQLSPDGRYVACLRTEGSGFHALLEVVDTRQAQRTTLAEVKDVPAKGAAWEELTSVVWLDAQHILYSKVKWPSGGTFKGSQGEIWLSSVDGKEQHLLATGSIYRVLGSASKGQTLYVTRLIPGWEEWRDEGFVRLDVASGEMENLWPQEEGGARGSSLYKLVTLPSGAQRLLFLGPGKGMPTIWQADPEIKQAKAIWTVKHGETYTKGTTISGTLYATPDDFLWSPQSDHEFVYLAAGAVWRVDMETGQDVQVVQFTAGAGRLLVAWTAQGLVEQSWKWDANWNKLSLWNEAGEVVGEITLAGH